MSENILKWVLYDYGWYPVRPRHFSRFDAFPVWSASSRETGGMSRSGLGLVDPARSND